jgi:hypothetical protein
MTLGHLLLLHVLAGIGVAGAVYVSARPNNNVRWFLVLTAPLFWPLYLPILLAQKTRTAMPIAESAGPDPVIDDLARAIAQVDAELEGALQSLDGWAEDVLARDRDRLHELRLAWTAQAERIRAMDRLLGRSEYSPGMGVALEGPVGSDGVAGRLRSSQQVIQQNMERLRQVRQRTLDDLLSTLAWVRELVSMIHLAKFTGAPASRAEELVAQIAAAVEGLSALTWQEAAV